MSAKTPIVLLIIAAVLLAYVLVFERGRPGRREIESRSGLLVEGLVRELISRVRIASGEERIALLREGEGFDETWTLETPKPAPADPEVIEDYLRNWEFAIPVRTLQSPSPEYVRSFCIDAPKAEVTFEMGRGKVRVSLGSGSPVDGGGYVRIDDEPQVIVVSNDVVALFDRTASEFEIKGDAGAPNLSDLGAPPEGPEGSAEETDAAVAAP